MNRAKQKGWSKREAIGTREAKEARGTGVFASPFLHKPRKTVRWLLPSTAVVVQHFCSTLRSRFSIHNGYGSQHISKKSGGDLEHIDSRSVTARNLLRMKGH